MPKKKSSTSDTSASKKSSSSNKNPYLLSEAQCPEKKARGALRLEEAKRLAAKRRSSTAQPMRIFLNASPEQLKAAQDAQRKREN